MASCGHADAWLDHTGTTSALAVSIVVRLIWYQLVVDRYPEYGLGFGGCLWQTTSRYGVPHIYHSEAVWLALIDVNCLRIYRVQVMEDDVAGPYPWHDMVVAQSTELEAKRHMIGNSQPCVTSGNEESHCGFEQEHLVRKCLSSCPCHLPILCSLVVVSWSWPKLAGARRLPDAETRLLGPHSYDTSNARS
jgi:hypothetical protein